MGIDYYLNEQVPEHRTSIYERGTMRNLALSDREACRLLNEKQAEINRLQGAIKRHDLDYIELSAILLESRRGLVSAKHFGEHISNMLKRVDREALRLLERQGGEA